MINRVILSFFFLLISSFNNANSIENKILLKIDNQIVTTIDVLKEINYLKSINKEINEFENDKIIIIAKNSIVKHKVKNLELLKYFEKIELEEKDLNILLKDSYTKLGLKNKKNFKTYLENFNLSLDFISEKILTEFFWNQLVYSKYKNNIKIDVEEIKKELRTYNSLNQKKYLLSEIVFNLNDNENLDNKIKKIQNTIENDGFESAALIYSISGSASSGGKLGWISSSSINQLIKNEIVKLSINQYTDPIKIPGGFLIIKVDDIGEEKNKINFEQQVKNLINTKTNEQLKNYSNIYFNKVLKNIVIDEI